MKIYLRNRSCISKRRNSSSTSRSSISNSRSSCNSGCCPDSCTTKRSCINRKINRGGLDSSNSRKIAAAAAKPGEAAVAEAEATVPQATAIPAVAAKKGNI